MSRHRLMAYLPTRGVGTHQTNRSIRSPLQPPSAAQEATSMPRLDLAPALHRPPICERLGPNQDAHSIISNRYRAWHDDDVHRATVRVATRTPAGPLTGAVKRSLGMVIGRMTGVPARMARDHGPLGDASRKRYSHSASDRPPTSPSTPGRRTPVYGSKIFGSPAKPEGWMMTISSFNISPSTWGNMFEHGSNSSRTTASTIGRTSRGSSSETSRGHMSA